MEGGGLALLRYQIRLIACINRYVHYRPGETRVLSSLFQNTKTDQVFRNLCHLFSPTAHEYTQEQWHVGELTEQQDCFFCLFCCESL